MELLILIGGLYALYVVGNAIAALLVSMISATLNKTCSFIIKNSLQSLVFVKAYIKKSFWLSWHLLFFQ